MLHFSKINDPKKSEKSPRSRNTQRRRKEEEKRESKSDAYFSLSSERVLLCLHGPSRAIALVSLLTFCFLLFSSDNNAFKERALKKDIKNIYSLNSIKSELFDFNTDILNYMSKSNICITRAGASTLAELIYLTVPHIAIPLPSARDNHQFENALFYNQLGCNWILNENETNTASLMNKLVNIIEDREEYLEKKKNMKNFNYQNTWNNINQKIITTINEN